MLFHSPLRKALADDFKAVQPKLLAGHLNCYNLKASTLTLATMPPEART
jgi:hypothetical protein